MTNLLRMRVGQLVKLHIDRGNTENFLKSSLKNTFKSWACSHFWRGVWIPIFVHAWILVDFFWSTDLKSLVATACIKTKLTYIIEVHLNRFLIKNCNINTIFNFKHWMALLLEQASELDILNVPNIVNVALFSSTGHTVLVYRYSTSNLARTSLRGKKKNYSQFDDTIYRMYWSMLLG